MITATEAAPLRLAAPARAPAIEADEIAAEDQCGRAAELHDQSERYATWRRRRGFGPGPLKGSILGRLQGVSAKPIVHFDIECSAELSAFHLAYICQPAEALDRLAFDAYYLIRARPVKRVALALGVSPQHFYRLLSAFRVRVANAAAALEHEARTVRPAVVADETD